MIETNALSLKRARNLWLFILVRGLLYLYVAFIYLTTDLIRYKWLSKVFIVAFIASGVSEILFQLIVFRVPDIKRLLVCFYDIVLGGFLLIFPLFMVVTLPLYIAIALILRGVVDLIAAKSSKPGLYFTAKVLRAYSGVRLLLALVIVVATSIAPSSIVFTGIAFILLGTVNIIFSLGLLRLKLTPQ